MPLAVKVENLDSVPENLHAAYVESDDGGYRLDADLGDAEDVSALKATLNKTNKKNRETDKALREMNKKMEQYSVLADLGEDVELSDIVDRYHAYDNRDKDHEARLADAKSQIEARFAKDLKRRDDDLLSANQKVENAEKGLTNYMISNEQQKAAAEAGVSAKYLSHVVKLTAERMSRNDEGKVVLLDDQGIEESMTLKEYYSGQFKEEFPIYYEGTKATGTGAKPSRPLGNRQPSDMSSREKIEQGLNQLN